MNCWAFPAACRNPANELLRRLGDEKVNIAGHDIGAEGGSGEHQRPRRFPERRCHRARTASRPPTLSHELPRFFRQTQDQEVRFGETPKPAREARALPRQPSFRVNFRELSSRNAKLELVPQKQHQQRPKYRNDYACRMKLRAFPGAGKQVRH